MLLVAAKDLPDRSVLQAQVQHAPALSDDYSVAFVHTEAGRHVRWDISVPLLISALPSNPTAHRVTSEDTACSVTRNPLRNFYPRTPPLGPP